MVFNSLISAKSSKSETIGANSPVLIVGYPGGGLVGPISVAYITQSLKMEQIGEFEHPHLPPMVFIENGEIHGPVRVFKKNNVFTLVADVPLNTDMAYGLADLLVEFCSKHKIRKVILMNGVEATDRNVDNLKTYGLVTSEILENILYEENIPKFLTGVISGPDAVLINVFKKARIPLMILSTECNFFFPDPEAAIFAIKRLSKMLEVKVDTSQLQQKIDHLRLTHRQLMQETVQALKQIEEEGQPQGPAPQIYR